MTDGQQELLALLQRIFADEYIEPAERAELRRVAAEHHLSAQAMAEVLEAFVNTLWAETIADGVVSEEERRRLSALVDGLHLPDNVVPEAVRRALGS